MKTSNGQPLSKSLQKAIPILHGPGTEDFERWLRLELGGYFASNSAMDEDIVVPEYRTVIGQHADISGRVLMPPPDLAFINETRLRNGVEELEALVASRDTVVIHDPHMCELIKQYLNVEVYSFRFSTVHLVGILSAIRTEFETKLGELNISSVALTQNTGVKNNDIVQVRPNLYGIGVDLRSIWRRWKGSK